MLRVEQVADFHLDEVEQFRIVDHVALVHEGDDGRHADLAGEQDVLAGLRHRAVRGADDEDRTVHLGGAGDHVASRSPAWPGQSTCA